MEWWQTLIIAAVPTIVTAASLVIQSMMNNGREDRRLAADAKHREEERAHAETMAREARDTEREVAATQRKDDADAGWSAAHVEMLTALDEIYYKLNEYKQQVTSQPRVLTFLAAEPRISRLIAAHSVIRVVPGNDLVLGDLDPIVDMLVDIHAKTVDSQNPPGELALLDNYAAMRAKYVDMIEVVRQQRSG
ncbi:hypothetical protein [Jiangella alba]|uniref:Uncharacterized protein n=1 Tax=Jiangella alba TaxID=561176 RepID=A0A1H5MQX5_9ACTN|nr:hypothetical protein [Jiangella alba]SEE91041.1 hypothetical protein SAMN04488561_3309 [Jiangella alba]